MADLQGGRKALNNVQAPAEAKAGGKADEGRTDCTFVVSTVARVLLLLRVSSLKLPTAFAADGRYVFAVLRLHA